MVRSQLIQLCGELLAAKSPAAAALADVIGQIDEDVISISGLAGKIHWTDGIDQQSAPAIAENHSDQYTICRPSHPKSPGWRFARCLGPPVSPESSFEFHRGEEMAIANISAIQSDQRERLLTQAVASMAVGARFVWPDGSDAMAEYTAGYIDSQGKIL